jgi:hypothetical protein
MKCRNLFQGKRSVGWLPAMITTYLIAWKMFYGKAALMAGRCTKTAVYKLIYP